MYYSNTVVMHTPKEKLMGYTKENILCTYMMSKILRKIGKSAIKREWRVGYVCRHTLSSTATS